MYSRKLFHLSPWERHFSWMKSLIKCWVCLPAALTEDKAALEKELSELREKNIADLEQRQEEHRKELQTLQQRLEVEKQEEVERGAWYGRLLNRGPRLKAYKHV